MVKLQCQTCKNYWGSSVCKAFQDGIPDEIIIGDGDHTKPYKGDNGIVFEPIEKHE